MGICQIPADKFILYQKGKPSGNGWREIICRENAAGRKVYIRAIMGAIAQKLYQIQKET